MGRGQAGEEGGPGPPWMYLSCISYVSFLFFPGGRQSGQSPLLFHLFFFPFPLFGGQWEWGGRGALLGLIILVWDRTWSCTNSLPLSRQRDKKYKNNHT